MTRFRIVLPLMMAFVLVFMGACKTGGETPEASASPAVSESPTESASPEATAEASPEESPEPTDSPVVDQPEEMNDDYAWYAMCMPVVDEDAFRTLCNDVMADEEGLKAYSARNGKLGEWCFLQTNPDGSQFAVLVQYARPSFMTKLLESEHEFDTWLVETINAVSGTNLAEMVADPNFAPNELVFDVNFEIDSEGHTPAAFAAPLAPNMTQTWLDLCSEIKNDRLDAYSESRIEKGFSREAGWLQRMPEMDVVIILQIAADHSTTMSAVMESESEFDVWFRENLFPAHGWDLETMTDEDMPEPNELVMSWWFEEE